jgi:hypothetical protein
LRAHPTSRLMALRKHQMKSQTTKPLCRAPKHGNLWMATRLLRYVPRNASKLITEYPLSRQLWRGSGFRTYQKSSSPVISVRAH